MLCKHAAKTKRCASDARIKQLQPGKHLLQKWRRAAEMQSDRPKNYNLSGERGEPEHSALRETDESSGYCGVLL